jgi:antitoxin (DNA-binding transcriptional repressor) of toxin-antitoxin stability system
MQIAIVEAQTRLLELIEAAQAGEEIVIIDYDGEAVRLVPILKKEVEGQEPS